MTGQYISTGDLPADGSTVDGVVDSFIASTGELWYVDSVFIAKYEANGGAGGQACRVVHETDNGFIQRSTGTTTGSSTNRTEEIAGFYLYEGEKVYVEETEDEYDNEAHRWRIAARRVL